MVGGVVKSLASASGGELVKNSSVLFDVFKMKIL